MRPVAHWVPRPAPALLAGLLLSAAALLSAGPGRAGEATAQSALGQEDAIQQALEQMPPGNTMTSYNCEDLVQPLISSLYRCTVQWGPLPR